MRGLKFSFPLNRSRLCAGAILLMSSILGSVAFSQLTATSTDPWDNTRRRNISFSDFQQVKPQIFFRVRESSILEAINELKNSPCVQIDLPTAVGFVGNNILVNDGSKPYLIRGLMVNDGNGGFYLTRKGRNLHVAHTSLGQPGTATRQPLVVFLNWAPKQVFVSTFGAI